MEEASTPSARRRHSGCIPTLAAASSSDGAQAQGIGFAIPSNLARGFAGQLIDDGYVTSTHRARDGQALTAKVALGEFSGA